LKKEVDTPENIKLIDVFDGKARIDILDDYLEANKI